LHKRNQNHFYRNPWDTQIQNINSIPARVLKEKIHFFENRGKQEKVYKFVPGAPEIGSLLFALTVILFMWAICYWMYKKRIYIKV